MYRHKLRKWLLFQSLTNSYPNYLFLLSCLFLEGMKNKQNSVSLRIIHRVHFSWLIFLCVHYAKELLYFFFLFFLQLFSSISSVCASSDIVHLHDWKNCANNALFTKKRRESYGKFEVWHKLISDLSRRNPIRSILGIACWRRYFAFDWNEIVIIWRRVCPSMQLFLSCIHCVVVFAWWCRALENH